MKRIASSAVACLFVLALASSTLGEDGHMQAGMMQGDGNSMQSGKTETAGQMHPMNSEMMQQCQKAHKAYNKKLEEIQAQIEQAKTQKNTNERLDSLIAAFETLVKSLEARQDGCPAAKWMKKSGQGMMHGGQSMMQGGGHQHETGMM
jgi:flagellar motility protein MotE (MotC chaperone)